MSERSEMPSSLYRFQLNEHFTLKQAIELLPYLQELGIEGVYCSPFYDSVNPHGYDVTDSNLLNPVLGTMAEFELFCSKLKKMGFFLIVDVVPNHMGIKKGKNAWWQDVLENGPYSEYALFFDIDWSPEKKELQDKVLLPILGDVYGEVLENQEIKLHFQNGVFSFQYEDFPLPMAPHSYAKVLEAGQELLKGHPEYEEYHAILELYRQFPVAVQERAVKKEEGRNRLAALCERAHDIRDFLQQQVTLLNGKKRLPESFDVLDKLLELQFYRLAFWKVASHEINYRRFFNILELVAICIEKEAVFEAHHRWVLELLKQKKIQGLRIDHPDGLYDPIAYFRRLRERGCQYTVVEKILDRKEELPPDWEVEGTVGYEYMNLLSGLFIRQSSEQAFTEIYARFLGVELDFDEIVYLSKKLFALYQMVSEVESLGLRLDRISEKNRLFRDFTRFDLTNALQEVIACFPVYRTYIGPEGGVSNRDATYLQNAIAKAKLRNFDVDPSIFNFLEKLLLLKLKLKEDEIQGFREFILRFQQLTGPIMAKGLEDTAFYIYNRFISSNDVGGDPPHFGYSIGDFHRFNQRKLELWPYGFLASSTHDSKRSEDVRMRLNVLSEFPKEWEHHVKKWEKINAQHKKDGAPTHNTEYFLYQSLLGVWPKRNLKPEQWTPFLERVWEVLLKSLREAQRETSWTRPNEAYEEAVKQFFFAILTPDKENPFLRSFLPFQRKMDFYGSWNSLAMVGLKIGSCGVVDIYQGNESWNYCLVDPDNRRPIDFEALKKLLKSIKRRGVIKDTEQTKLYIQWKALNFRKQHKSLFLEGEYIPLTVQGKRKDNVIAFARRYGEKMLIVCAARFFSEVNSKNLEAWDDTIVNIPMEYIGKEWMDLFTEKKALIEKSGNEAFIQARHLFELFPVSYLYEPVDDSPR